MRRLIIIASVGILFCGCVMNTGSIHIGLTRSEVYRNLGNPDSESKTQACWVDRLKSGWSWDKGNYCIKFDGNEVAEYGWDMIYIQEHNTNTHVILTP